MTVDAPILPIHVAWETDFEVGHALLDAQHRALLAQCDLLAELTGCEADPQRFDEAFARLRALAREHFETEAGVLLAAGDPDHGDCLLDGAEFDDLADDIVTTDHFDRIELQRFLALWWIGHLRGTVAHQRACVAAGPGHGR